MVKAKQEKKLVKTSNAEREARLAVLEDLFYDFNHNRNQVYRLNFFRGIFFGLGTVLGGTVVIALIIWTLGQFANWFPDISVPVNVITNSLQK